MAGRLISSRTFEFFRAGATRKGSSFREQALAGLIVGLRRAEERL